MCGSDCVFMRKSIGGQSLLFYLLKDFHPQEKNHRLVVTSFLLPSVLKLIMKPPHCIKNLPAILSLQIFMLNLFLLLKVLKE